MAKHIGIAACSAEGAALCYRTICNEAGALMGRHEHPEVTMHSHSFASYMENIYANRWEAVAELMLSSARKLSSAGADFAICPDNTIHQAFGLVEPDSAIPWLHIARTVARQAGEQGFKRLGVLGTKYLMTGPVYSEALESYGIGCEIPAQPDRERINSIIMDELVHGVFTDTSRRWFNEVIAGLKQRGCDAAVLGCTEIPLLVDSTDCPLPTLDSTRLLARAALAKAME